MSNARMTTLQGINVMLEALQVQRATALDTGGTSLRADAERLLDEETQAVQAEDWFSGATDQYEMKVPTITIAISGGSGTPEYDEYVEESVSGAVGIYKFSGSSIHLVPYSGTFTGGQTLTGQTSGFTRTGATLTEVAENFLFVNPAWVRVARSEIEPLRLSKRGDQLYDETNQTGSFESSVFLDVVRELYFTDLPYNLANYVAHKAAIRLEKWKRRSRQDNPDLVRAMMLARSRALQENEDLERVNVLDTAEARRIKGDRTEYHGRWL